MGQDAIAEDGEPFAADVGIGLGEEQPDDEVDVRPAVERGQHGAQPGDHLVDVAADLDVGVHVGRGRDRRRSFRDP